MAKKNQEETKPANPVDPTDGAPNDGPSQPPAPPVAPVLLPTRCRIIEVTEDDGLVSPAIVNQVTKLEDGTTTLNVMVFNPIMGSGNACIADAAAKYRAQPGEAGTWNWPPRA